MRARALGGLIGAACALPLDLDRPVVLPIGDAFGVLFSEPGGVCEHVGEPIEERGKPLPGRGLVAGRRGEAVTRVGDDGPLPAWGRIVRGPRRGLTASALRCPDDAERGSSAEL